MLIAICIQKGGVSVSNKKKSNRGKVYGASLGIGIALGVVLGLAINDLGLGIGIGVALGAIISLRNRGSN